MAIFHWLVWKVQINGRKPSHSFCLHTTSILYSLHSYIYTKVKHGNKNTLANFMTFGIKKVYFALD